MLCSCLPIHGEPLFSVGPALQAELVLLLSNWEEIPNLYLPKRLRPISKGTLILDAKPKGRLNLLGSLNEQKKSHPFLGCEALVGLGLGRCARCAAAQRCAAAAGDVSWNEGAGRVAFRFFASKQKAFYPE